MTDTQVETMISGTDAAHTSLEQASWEPLRYDDDNQGLFADATRPRINAYNDLATRGAELAAERKAILEDLETANARFAAAPTPADVKAAYDAYEDSFDNGDDVETHRLLQKWKALKQERDDALEAHTAAVEDIARRNTEWVEAMTELQEMLKNAGVIPDPSENDDWRDDQDKDDKPKGEGKPDSPSTPTRTLDDVIGGDDSTPTGKTQLSADTVAPAQSQSGYPTIYPAAAQQPTTAAAMPSPSITPAFNSALNPSPSRAQKDKEKEKKRAEERINPLPVPSPVPAAVPIDRGTSTTGVTTKDISGKPSPVTALTNAAPGAGAQTAGGRGGVGGGGVVGGGMPGGGGSIGAGNKTTTSQKILDSDRTLARRPDDDPSVSGGIVSKENLDENARKEAAADDEILRRNAAGETQKKDDKR